MYLFLLYINDWLPINIFCQKNILFNDFQTANIINFLSTVLYYRTKYGYKDSDFFFLEMDHSFSSIKFRTVLYFKTKYGYKDSDFFFF